MVLVQPVILSFNQFMLTTNFIRSALATLLLLAGIVGTSSTLAGTGAQATIDIRVTLNSTDIPEIAKLRPVAGCPSQNPQSKALTDRCNSHQVFAVNREADRLVVTVTPI